MAARRFSPVTVAILILGAGGLWWFFPREDASVWRFSPDVSLSGGNSRARSVVFSPDGRTLAVSALIFPSTYPRSSHSRGSRQRRCEVQLWDVPSRQRKTSLIISDADVPRGASDPEMAFSRGGQRLRFWSSGTTTWDVGSAARLSAGSDGWVPPSLWDTPEAATKRVPWWGKEELVVNCREVEFSGDGLWCAAKFLNSSKSFLGEFVSLWRRAALGKPWHNAGTMPATVFRSQIIYDLALSHDGKLLAVALHDGSLQLFETARLRFWKSLPSSNWITQLAFSPDNHYLLGSGGNNAQNRLTRQGGVLNFWNVGSGSLEHSIKSPKVLHSPVFSPDGRWVGATEGEATVFVCESPLYRPQNPTAP